MTWRLAVPVAPGAVPVMVWVPAVVAVQTAAAQEPSGAIVKVVLAVMLPRELSYLSRPWAV